MPGYRGHIAGALVVWSIVMILILSICSTTCAQALEWACAMIVGALFPDLDTKSMGQKWLYRMLFFAGLCCVISGHYRWASTMLLVACIPLMVPHRGIMHSSVFIICTTVGAAYLLSLRFSSYQLAIVGDAFFFGLGALSHIFLDRHV